jgi:hypothetical protein
MDEVEIANFLYFPRAPDGNMTGYGGLLLCHLSIPAVTARVQQQLYDSLF